MPVNPATPPHLPPHHGGPDHHITSHDGTGGDNPARDVSGDLATPRILRVLLDGQQRHPMGELAARAMLLDAAAARIVDRLARAGWIAREADPHDPHQVLIRLTAHGRARHAQHTGGDTRPVPAETPHSPISASGPTTNSPTSSSTTAR